MANVSNYTEQGGDKTVVGGEIDVTGALKKDSTEITATAAELNYLDNDDLTAADLQKLADITSAASALNVLITNTTDETADGTINERSLVKIDGSGDHVESTADSLNVVGINYEDAVISSTESLTMGILGEQTGVADAEIDAGKNLKACAGGRVGQLVDTDLSGTALISAQTGDDFSNQPAGDDVELVSDAAGDTGIAVTIYGTDATDAYQTEVITTDGADGTTPVISASSYNNIMGAEITSGTPTGTLTIREATGDLAIATLTSGGTTSGIYEPTDTRAFNVEPTAVASAGETGYLVVVGTDGDYAAQGEAKQMEGATAVTLANAYNTVDKVCLGDTSVDITASVGAEEDENKKVGKSNGAAASKDTTVDFILTI